jgi:hypothetical protein
MLHHAALVRTNVSEEHDNSSFIIEACRVSGQFGYICIYGLQGSGGPDQPEPGLRRHKYWAEKQIS